MVFEEQAQRVPDGLVSAVVSALLDVTSHHIYQIYGIYQPRLIATRKLIEKEAARTQTANKNRIFS